MLCVGLGLPDHIDRCHSAFAGNLAKVYQTAFDLFIKILMFSQVFQYQILDTGGHHPAAAVLTQFVHGHIQVGFGFAGMIALEPNGVELARLHGLLTDG